MISTQTGITPKWLTDITEFHIPAGKVYLSPIIDCFDGLPVSWTIGTSPDAELVNTMPDSAIATLNDSERPIIHSDYTEEKTMPKFLTKLCIYCLYIIFFGIVSQVNQVNRLPS